ncbi:MAG: CocE/NonD family hydrolase [Pseudomonadota bacterium]|nr:CocE/NonD family hydrolase [Pseudomonadota bacterium]
MQWNYLAPWLRGSLLVLFAGLILACSGEDKDPQVATDRSVEAATETPAPEAPEASLPKQSLPNDQLWYQRPYEYPHMVNLPPQFVTMSTGKKLSVRVSLPANEEGVPAPGSFPVILTQSGYNTNLLSLLFMGAPGNLMLGTPDYFLVRRGYVQVAVDALGTGASEGGWELFGEEEQIGFADMVDWVQQQTWSNGRLGVAGVSYMAISSLFAAQRRPDDIDAVFASLPLGDAMRGIVGTGGLINAHFIRTWVSITQVLSTQNIPAMLAYPGHMQQLMDSTQQHVDQIDAFYLPLIEDALWDAPHISYWGDFWRTRSPLVNMDKIKAPTFIFGALDDLFQRDEPLLYEQLKQNGVDARLVIYNGYHMANFVMSHIGNEQVPPIDYLMLQWFDRYLRDMETGTEDIPAVVQYVKNYPTERTPEPYRNDSFISTTDWPHPAAKPERWYLHADHRLSRSAPVAEEPSLLMSNPEHPVMRAERKGGLLIFEVEINDGTRCSRSFDQWMLGLALPKSECIYNSRDTEQQRLVFESEPMPEDYFINGPIQADLWITSTVSDAVVSVQIEEISAQQDFPLTNGQLLASMRAVDRTRSRYLEGEMIQPYHVLTQASALPLVPGEAVQLQIEVFPTSAVIRKGNKLRVSVSPSNQAQGMLNYPRQEATEGGVTSLLFAPEQPSSVVLPIVPLTEMN